MKLNRGTLKTFILPIALALLTMFTSFLIARSVAKKEFENSVLMYEKETLDAKREKKQKIYTQLLILDYQTKYWINSLKQKGEVLANLTLQLEKIKSANNLVAISNMITGYVSEINGCNANITTQVSGVLSTLTEARLVFETPELSTVCDEIVATLQKNGFNFIAADSNSLSLVRSLFKKSSNYKDQMYALLEYCNIPSNTDYQIAIDKILAIMDDEISGNIQEELKASNILRP